jgi:hypothetical protein
LAATLKPFCASHVFSASVLSLISSLLRLLSAEPI